MESRNLIFSHLIAFLSHCLDPSRAAAAAFSSSSFDLAASRSVGAEEIFREYAQREINLLLWFSLIAITILLAMKLARALRFMVERESNNWPSLPFLLRPLQALHWQVSPGGSQ